MLVYVALCFVIVSDVLFICRFHVLLIDYLCLLLYFKLHLIRFKHFVDSRCLLLNLVLYDLCYLYDSLLYIYSILLRFQFYVLDSVYVTLLYFALLLSYLTVLCPMLCCSILVHTFHMCCCILSMTFFLFWILSYIIVLICYRILCFSNLISYYSDWVRFVCWFCPSLCWQMFYWGLSLHFYVVVSVRYIDRALRYLMLCLFYLVFLVLFVWIDFGQSYFRFTLLFFWTQSMFHECS